METVKEKQKKAFEALKKEFGYTNALAAPKLEKAIVSVGTGSKLKKDPKKNEFVEDRLARITGQKPSIRGAKKSVASFKIREGDPIGQLVTLRGSRMHSFLDKLIRVALPRTKDFRGISRDAIDEMGNLTIGLKEHTIFPETSDEELKNVFGMAVTIVTSAENKAEAERFFEEIGIPFRQKQEE